MPIKMKKLGSKKGIERSLKGGGGRYALRVPEEGVTVRYLTEPEEWYQVEMHFDQDRKTSYPCSGLDDGCIACEEGQEARARWFSVVYNVDDEQVTVFEMPKSVVKALYKKYERYNTITDRNYEITKEGTGLNTSYEVEAFSPEHIRGQDKMEVIDLEAFLTNMQDEAMRQIDGVEETITSRGRRRSAAPSRRSQSRRRQELVDEDEIPDDDDFDDEEVQKPVKRSRPKSPMKKSTTTKRRTVRR